MMHVYRISASAKSGAAAFGNKSCVSGKATGERGLIVKMPSIKM